LYSVVSPSRLPLGSNVKVISPLLAVAVAEVKSSHVVKLSLVFDSCTVPVQLVSVDAVIVDVSIASLNVITISSAVGTDDAPSAGVVLDTVGAVVSPGGVSSSLLSSHPVKSAKLMITAHIVKKDILLNNFLFIENPPF
jgi:hypothetical protein